MKATTKLNSFVQAMVAGGYFKGYAQHETTEVYEAGSMREKRYGVFGLVGKGVAWRFDFTIPQIIADVKAMKAVYGDEAICSKDCGIVFSGVHEHDPCNSSKCDMRTPAPIYYASGALKSIHENEDVIDYLYQNIRKGEAKQMAYLHDQIHRIQRVFKLTQRQLAIVLSTTEINIHRWKRRKVRKPYSQVAQKKINALHGAAKVLNARSSCGLCGKKWDKKVLMMYSTTPAFGCTSRLLCKRCFNSMEPELYFK